MKNMIIDYIQAEDLLEPGDNVVLGVSGGADSVCLFLFLKELEKTYGLSLLVVHVEHGIRGEESKEDAAFVETLCREQKTACRIISVDVPAFAKQNKCGEEEAGRLVRRRAYVTCGREHFGRRFKIALGHHMDDAAETLLFSLARGTGLTGLCGIRPKSRLTGLLEEVEVIHPLLCLRRQQIEDELRRRKIGWRTDRTNASDAYTRNRLRHMIVPELQACNSRAVEHLAETASLMRQMEGYIKEQALAAYEQALGADGSLHRGRLAALHPALAGEVVRLWLVSAGVSLKDISHIHFDAVCALAKGAPGRQTDLPGDWRVSCGYDKLVLTKKDRNRPQQSLVKIPDEAQKKPVMLSFTKDRLEQGVAVTFGGYRFAFLVLDRQKFDQKVGRERLYLENSFSICVSYDKIDEICLRFPQQGERMVIAKDGRHKSLKRLWIDNRIERAVRSEIPVVTNGKEIIWVVGVRDCPAFFVEDETKRVLVGKAWRYGYERKDQSDDSRR